MAITLLKLQKEIIIEALENIHDSYASYSEEDVAMGIEISDLLALIKKHDEIVLTEELTQK
jgi:hypothetical protein